MPVADLKRRDPRVRMSSGINRPVWGRRKKNKGQIWPQLLRPTERALARDRQLVRGIVTLAGTEKNPNGLAKAVNLTGWTCDI